MLLGELGPDGRPALPFLTPLLQDTNEVSYYLDGGKEVRHDVAEAISKIDPAMAASSMSDKLKDKDESVREQALADFRKMGSAELPNLLDIWGSQDVDPDIRKDISKTVYLILRDMDDDNAASEESNSNRPRKTIGSKLDSYVPGLIRELKEVDYDLRLNALVVLEHIGPGAKAAVPSLLVCLSDSDPVIRFSAANALVAIGIEAKAAIPELIKALGTEQVGEVRYYFAQALGNFGTESRSAVPVLIKTLKDEDPKVRQISAWALGQIGAEAGEGIAPLVESLKDDDSECRTNAADAFT